MKSLFKRGIGHLVSNGRLDWMEDESYLKLMYWLRIGTKLNLSNPQTFNEKLQWLKIHDRKPEYTILADKYTVKQYVEDKIGKDYIIPTLGVWKSFDDIDFKNLPNEFVLKCTHDSGGLVIVKDKRHFHFAEAKKKIEHCLKRNYFLHSREFPYKNINPQIIAEKYMSDDLADYKLMCFNGKVKCSFTCTNRFSKEGLEVTFYDRQWNKMPFERYYPSGTATEKPTSYDQMILLAEILSKNIPFVRIDFYEIESSPYFGEITFFPGAGLEPFSPPRWDKVLGDWINLNDV